MLGRALYEGVLLEAPLAPFFVGVLQVTAGRAGRRIGRAQMTRGGCLCIMPSQAPGPPPEHALPRSRTAHCTRAQGRRPLFDELAGLDPEVHRSLAALKRYEGDWADLGLDFTGGWRAAAAAACRSYRHTARRAEETDRRPLTCYPPRLHTPCCFAPPTQHPPSRLISLPCSRIRLPWQHRQRGAGGGGQPPGGDCRQRAAGGRMGGRVGVGGGCTGCCMQAWHRSGATYHPPIIHPPLPAPLSLSHPQYVYLVADWHLNKRLGPAAAAFSRGLSRVRWQGRAVQRGSHTHGLCGGLAVCSLACSPCTELTGSPHTLCLLHHCTAAHCQVIPAPWLRLFSPKEVNQLLGGGEAGAIDIEDMRQHTVYRWGGGGSARAGVGAQPGRAVSWPCRAAPGQSAGWPCCACTALIKSPPRARFFGRCSGYSATSSTVKHFWAVVRVLGPGDQRALLKFITSSSRAPLGG